MDLSVPTGSTTPAGDALEEAIEAGREGRLTSQELLGVIWTAEILSVGRLEEEGNPDSFQALVLKAPDGAAPVAATFTKEERIPAKIRDAAPVIVRASGQATIRSIAPGYGLAINPGSDLGLELGPEGVEAIVQAAEQAVERGAGTSGTDA
ncbi:hypothetical protein BN1051_02513 [Arthrobacter saudimassiliensis]|uniref:SseB protein N-terminal domain-containing protein n=1 Tax=Arthrobacter saudimassiliensis TaxID=1461584 RepID=A0A078MPK9_9MICC|nr:hypothetical protein BN1051_02513 [Arthrobacter saudimassiliensis]